MTPREIVRRTLDFQGPERIAMCLPGPWLNDFIGAGAQDDPDHPSDSWRKIDEKRWEFVDEWGNLWGRIDETSKGEVIRGALQDWSQLDSLQLPDYRLPARFEQARQTFADNPDKYHLTGIPGFVFNIARKIRKLEVYLADLCLEQENIRRLHTRIEETLAQLIDNLAAAGADGIMFAEDWGCQDRLLIDPAMWREIFKPSFQRLCDRIHGHGMHVLMHSCGYIRDILPDLIEVGVNAIQMDQPELFGIDELDADFGGRLTFWCPVDIQKTLQTGDPVRIEASARRMVEKFGGHQGGFIAGHYGDNRSIGVDPEIQAVACRAFMQYGCSGS